MSGTKEFFDLLSNDEDIKIELGTKSLRALMNLLAENGLKDKAQEVLEGVTAKVAQAHGFDLNAMEELSEEELKSVAGGYMCEECINYRGKPCGDSLNYN